MKNGYLMIILKNLQTYIINNGGGHNMAAGFTLKFENLLDFKKFNK